MTELKIFIFFLIFDFLSPEMIKMSNCELSFPKKEANYDAGRGIKKEKRLQNKNILFLSLAWAGEESTTCSVVCLLDFLVIPNTV